VLLHASSARLGLHCFTRAVHISWLHATVKERDIKSIMEEHCGPVKDVRLCVKPKSKGFKAFAFVQFESAESASAALDTMHGSVLFGRQVDVRCSNTAITPVADSYLPHNAEEEEARKRTIFMSNLDSTLTKTAISRFLHKRAHGDVQRIRLVHDKTSYDTKYAFVELESATSSTRAIRLSGFKLAEREIRVTPSKAPVRDRFESVVASGSVHWKRSGPKTAGIFLPR